MKKAYIYINYNNIVVLKDYLDVIKTALEKQGFNCSYVKSLTNCEKKDLIVFPMGVDAFKYYFCGYHNFILWQQGVTGEESYMRNHSKLRRMMLNAIDCYAMRKSRLNFFVSEELRNYYQAKSCFDLENKSYIMPCYNEKYDEEFLSDKLYGERKIFTYVGSLDLWQCFEQTIDIYKSIENECDNVELKVLTFQVEEAKKILREKNVKNYSVKCVEKEKVKKELKECTYGFIIRDDIIVNRVATPTKLSSYMAAGVLPILSSCITAYSQDDLIKKASYIYDGDNSKLLEYVKDKLDSEITLSSIKSVFEGRFNTGTHVEKITLLLNKLGIEGNK